MLHRRLAGAGAVPLRRASRFCFLRRERRQSIALLCLYLVDRLGRIWQWRGDAGLVQHDRQGAASQANGGSSSASAEGLGTLMGIIGAFFVGRRARRSMGYPLSFASALPGCHQYSWASPGLDLALNREPESPIVKEHVPFQRITFGSLPAILRRKSQLSTIPAQLRASAA